MYVEKTKTLIQKDNCTSMFIAALFTIVKTWTPPKCPSTDKENVIHTQIGILLIIKRNEIMPYCSNMDEPRDYHTK